MGKSVLVVLGVPVLLAATGCDVAPAGTPDAGVPDAGPSGLALLGGYTHDPASVAIEEITTEADDLRRPRDLAFRPGATNELWVVDEEAGVMILAGAGTATRSVSWHHGPGADHFMPAPSALAFGDTTMATAHETDAVTQPTTPADFMGPALWLTDPAIFDGGHASHIDMLHNSPNAVGIAWDTGNVFWVFDGFHLSITRYDFALDHGPGGEDHTDGVITRYVQNEVGYRPNVSSHMELDHASGLLYAADTSNSRIVVLDTRSGTPGAVIGPDYDGADMSLVDGATLTTLVDGATRGLETPTGLALHGGVVYVTDYADSVIHAYDLSGEELDWLDLSSMVSARSLGAVEVDADGRLYVIDILGRRIIRIAPL